MSSIRPIPVANTYWIEKEEKDSSYANPYVSSPRETEKTSKIQQEKPKVSRSNYNRNVKVVSPIKKKQWVEVNKDKEYENILYKPKGNLKNNNNQSELPLQNEKVSSNKKVESFNFESNPNEKVIMDQNKSFEEILPFVHHNN